MTDYVALGKPRLTLMVAVTTVIGYLVAPGAMDGILLTQVVMGTVLAAMGASALNMVLEASADAKMRRTQNRPIPAGRMSGAEATWFGVTASVSGVAFLVTVNGLSAALAALTIVTYLFCYTPLKSRTSLCTLVGAIPGAIPPLIGWCAATGTLGVDAVVLFAILFLWQLPHFLAIAWIYRDDYGRAGYPMLAVLDSDGSLTGRQVVLQSVVLVAVSLLPVQLGWAGAGYRMGAILLGLGFVALAFLFAVGPTVASARRLFVGSLLYLPAVFILLTFSRGLSA